MIQTLRNNQNAQKPSFGELRFENLPKKTAALINKAIKDPALKRPFAEVTDMYDVVIRNSDTTIDGVKHVEAQVMMLQEPHSNQGADIIRFLLHDGKFYGDSTNLNTIKGFLAQIPKNVIQIQNNLLKESAKRVKAFAEMLNVK